MAEDPDAVPTIACIVEGQADELAFPLLVRRITEDIDPASYIQVVITKRVPRDALIRPDGIERAVEQTARMIGPSGAILTLIDADDDCPATLGPHLLHRARHIRPNRLISVVLAKREYEAWFLAAAASLAGKRGLPSDLRPPPDPESIRGAKEWLGRHLPHGRKYSETTDQPALTAVFNLHQARRADSFDKCYREIAKLIAVLTEPPPTER